ncbi:MAG TPA: hypothetical protein DC049_06585 [Spirochaetia bacterium]|nr:hypothetical protein [Spirochaetia bacterium]
MLKRVVVTGIGVINSIAKNTSELKTALLQGHSGLKKNDRFNTAEYRNEYGFLISGMSEMLSTQPEIKKYKITSQYGIIAAKEALHLSKLSSCKMDAQRIGVCMGTTLVGVTDWIKYFEQEKKDISLFLSNQSNLSGDIAEYFNFKGNVSTISTACAASTNSIGYAYQLIKNGKSDYMIAGGSDPFTCFSLSGFNTMKVVATDTCRPFDSNRTGMMLGEGGAVVLLETVESAIQREAKIYAEIAGFATGNDAYHPTAQDPSGEGIFEMLQRCFKNSIINPDAIDYINAHGTGTKGNDSTELKALYKTFGEHLYKIPISSTKSQIGHTLGAAGANELVCCIVAMENNFLPPTINTRNTINIDHNVCQKLDFVLNKGRFVEKLKTILSTSYAFGGNTAAIIIKRYE